MESDPGVFTELIKGFGEWLFANWADRQHSGAMLMLKLSNCHVDTLVLNLPTVFAKLRMNVKLK